MSFQKEIETKLVITDQGGNHMLVEVRGPNGNPWFNFCLTPKTMNLNKYSMSLMDPFLKRLSKWMGQ